MSRLPPGTKVCPDCKGYMFDEDDALCSTCKGDGFIDDESAHEEPFYREPEPMP